ncbi:MAG: LemA protein [Hyphomicrobiaceae bacterium]|jgi:LemA protein
MKLVLTRPALAAILVCTIIGSGCGYNDLVRFGEGVDAAWGEIDNQLQRRNDLVPNLIETVKGYAKHEKEVLLKVTEARSRVAGAGSPGEAMTASNELSGALARLLVVMERYPDLKANQSFLRLQDELAGTENRLAVARTRYNETVREFNTQAKSFPRNFTAKLFGFAVRPYFEIPEEARSVPAVKF